MGEVPGSLWASVFLSVKWACGSSSPSPFHPVQSHKFLLRAISCQVLSQALGMHQSAKQVVMRSCETLGVDVTFGSRKSRLGEWRPLSYWLSGGCYPVTLSHKRGPGWGTRDSVSGAEAGGEKAWFRERESGGCAPGNALFCFPDLALGKVPSGLHFSPPRRV